MIYQKNRLIILTRPEEDSDIVYIRLSGELNSPEFVSTRDLKNEDIVKIVRRDTISLP